MHCVHDTPALGAVAPMLDCKHSSGSSFAVRDIAPHAEIDTVNIDLIYSLRPHDSFAAAGLRHANHAMLRYLACNLRAFADPEVCNPRLCR